MDTSTRLAELLCARLCHDLSGPLGTVTAAAEMAEADGAYQADAAHLMAEGAKQATRRLRLLRAAWAGDGGEMAPADLMELATGLPAAHRVRLDAAGLSPAAPIPAERARVLLNVIMLAAEGLPAGGTVRLDEGLDADILVLIDGPRAAWPPGLAAALADPAAALDGPREVQAPFAVLLAREAGLRLSLLLPIGQTGMAPPLRISPG